MSLTVLVVSNKKNVLRILSSLGLVIVLSGFLPWGSQVIQPYAKSAQPKLDYSAIKEIMKKQPPMQSDSFDLGWNAVKGEGDLSNRNSAAVPWRFAHMQTAAAGIVVQDPVDPSNMCMQFQWFKGKGQEFDAANTQKKAHLYGDFAPHSRTEELWHFDIYFPTQGMEADSEPEILIQWHGHPDLLEAHRPPPIALVNENDSLILVWRYDARRYTPPKFEGWDVKKFVLGPTPKDRWVNFVFHIGWSPEGQGFLSAWQDHELKAHFSPIPLGFNDKSGIYIGYGIYKFTLQSTRDMRRALYDNVKHWTIRQ